MLLNDKLKPFRLLLASQSPRRRELMTGCGLPYELAPKYDCEEIYPEDLPAEQVPLFLSRLKSETYPVPLAPNDILLTADTVVVLDGEVLGKPHSRDDALRMLSFEVRTSVWFRTLAAEEIEHYVDTYRPFDKAGSYGIQEWIGYAAIERIEGSFYHVMGLPIQKVYTELDKFLDS